MMWHWIVGMCLLPVCATYSIAQGTGRLPRGKTPPATTDTKSEAPADPSQKYDDGIKSNAKDASKTMSRSMEEDFCRTYLVSPTNPRLFNDGNFTYYLSRVGRATSTNGVEQFKYQLMRLSLAKDKSGVIKQENKTPKLLGFEGPSFVGIVPHESPPVGFTVLSFSGVDDGCARGEAVGVTMPLQHTSSSQNKASRAVPLAAYLIVDSNAGRFFADPEKGVIKTVDPLNNQQRTVYQTEKMQKPLYWDTKKKVAYVFQTLPAPSLSRRGSVTSIKLGDLTLQRGEKLLQDKDLFALTRINSAENSISVAQLDQWSALNKSVLHVLKLPKGTLADTANMLVSFKEELAVVYRAPYTEPTWDQIFIYKLKEGMVADLSWPKTERLAGITFSPKSDFILALFENEVDGVHSGVKVYDIAKRVWTPLTL